METDQLCKQTGANVASISCEKIDCIRYDASSGKVETSHSSTVLVLDQQTPGKQKKTPFKFFAGRKCICTLPSFFGKHKGTSKGGSRKLLSKSKTHDGISGVPEEDGKKAFSSNNPSGHEHTMPGDSLPSSHSADSGITSPVKLDFNFHDSFLAGSTECFDKKLNGEKSQSFPRPKKGLKGLFSSIRYHKKNKSCATEKCERSDHCVSSINFQQVNKECLTEESCSEQTNLPCVDTSSPGYSLDAAHEKEAIVECSASIPRVPSPTDKYLETDTVGSVNQNPTIETESTLPCSIDDTECCQTVNADFKDRDPPSVPGGEQANLIFEDVSSLKSFDSLTGCGDIIADQEIDNISDTVSLERSREATKRSSCLVTYQGGGEAMATPDDTEEEYFHQLLDENSESEKVYDVNKEKENNEMPKGFICLETTDYHLGVKDPFDRTVTCNTDLLTPQSDQQESAPNSDEGYYDSTTPGPDEETREGFTPKERLPRDSYSGDALYEFYEPDDNLMSPEPGSESLYESKTPCSDIYDHFFDFSLHADSGLILDAKHKKCATETEEERLAVIQKQLLFWERQREAVLKGTAHVIPDILSKENKNNECENRAAVLMDRSKSCLDSELAKLQNTSKDGVHKGIQNVQMGKARCKDIRQMSFTNFQGIYSQNSESSCLTHDTGFEFNVGTLEAQDQGIIRKASAGSFSTSKITPVHHVQNVFCPDYDLQNECELTSKSSEALADFSSGMLFSSISECLGRGGSSSSFHHNLDSLPTMINFDIVDVDNEGECEQQVELSPDEEVDSSFETFDHNYVQESLADCEEPLFQMDFQQPDQGFNWGVASLPRHLDQYTLNPSITAPLSLMRRSKSLDTETMELELGGLHLSKSGLKTNDHCTRLDGEKNSWNYEHESLVGDGQWDGSHFLEKDIQKTGNFECYPPIISSTQSCRTDPQSQIVSNHLSKQNKQMSSSTMQCTTRHSQEVTHLYRYGENTTKKLALVLPLGEKREMDIHGSLYDSGKQVQNKPVGITQAIPQQHKHEEDSFEQTVNYQELSGFTKKGTVEPRGSDDWSNKYNECTNS
ncbi:APC membrane recruitment protein 1 [Spea bombifrons]|uniref:APC membrane recruitment protein 1 n=1 Tax=Spea bombifrons TaxID=233779 RepID=UPI00234984BE|nr:APC membrane recruitment protein 1 [Spea bombifrons]